MIKKRRYRNSTFAAIHSAAEGLFKVGAISKETLRDFDETCLITPSQLKPEEIKRLREAQHVSQPVFARYLNTSESTVEKWESGAKHPSGMALKLLSIVQKHGLEVLK